MSDALIGNVSDTALWVAAHRYRETGRPDALFHDPLAGRLAGEKGEEIAQRVAFSRFTSWVIVIRTWIIDRYILESIREGADTVLNLGAGLDTRPYRLELPPSLGWIEVDYPNIIARKEELLGNEKPRCRLDRVALDLRDQPARRYLLSDICARSSKILVITEGLLLYLSKEEVSSLAEDLRSREQFRFWIADYCAPEMIRLLRMGRSMRRQLKNAPVRFFPEDWFEFFRQHGWKARETRYYGEESERLGRAIPTPWWMGILGIFAPSRVRDAFKKFAGYVMFEPDR
jgi:methyltransferase (TIGR00027 family)